MATERLENSQNTSERNKFLMDMLKKPQINRQTLLVLSNYLTTKGYKEISYITFAIEFGISYNKASRVLRALAEMFKDRFEYRRGKLIIKV